MSEPNPAALKLAVAWLSRKELLEQEVAVKLASKGYDDAARELVLNWLKKKGVLNDTRTVNNALLRRSAGKKAEGRLKVQAELERRGATLEGFNFDLSDEAELAKMSSLLAEKRPADRARAGRLLVSRGFEEELIESVLDKYFGEQD